MRHESGSESFTYYSAGAIQHEVREYEHTGTVFGAITKGQFASLLIANPPLELVNVFDTYISFFDREIRANTSAIRILANLRDTLLPKLVSGEMRVGE